MSSAKKVASDLLQKLDAAKPRVAQGEELRAEQVVYSCRSKPRYKARGHLYTGKLNTRAVLCMSLDGSDSVAGTSIGFECVDMPDDPVVYQRKGAHKGMIGRLNGRVYCRVLAKYRNIPDGRC